MLSENYDPPCLPIEDPFETAVRPDPPCRSILEPLDTGFLSSELGLFSSFCDIIYFFKLLSILRKITNLSKYFAPIPTLTMPINN